MSRFSACNKISEAEKINKNTYVFRAKELVGITFFTRGNMNSVNQNNIGHLEMSSGLVRKLQ